MVGGVSADLNNDFDNLKKQVITLEKVVSSLASDKKLTMSAVKYALPVKRLDPKFEQNQSYSVLVFHKMTQEENAKKATEALRVVGFKSSQTQTSLKEAREQKSAGTAWIIWTENAKSKLDEIVDLLKKTLPNIKIDVRDDPYQLRRGDVQVLMF